MADYLLQATVFQDLEDQIILPEGMTWTQANADRTDFETNHKSQAVEINDILINSTTFEQFKNYQDLKAKIDGVTVNWTDVRYVTTSIGYTLYLLTASLL